MNRKLIVCAFACLGSALIGCGGGGSGSTRLGNYSATVLVSDQPVALLQDPNFVNPWAIALSPTGGNFWFSDNGTDKASVYSGDVNGSALVNNPALSAGVAVPGGKPTGQVFNSTTGFVVSSGAQSGAAIFIIASETGQITGWNPGVPAPPPSQSAQPGVTVAGAVFKGLAIGNVGANTFLYATDFHNNQVRVFNSTFTETSLAGSFADPNLPTGYGPFGIQNINGVLYVTYAKHQVSGDDDLAGAGNGFIDRYDLSGNLIGRFASQGSLNSPWGVVLAPANFGTFGGAVLVGNFGNGWINAFDPVSGKHLGALGAAGHPLVIPGLWGLVFGNGVTAGDANALYFTAGPNDEADGQFGKIVSN